MKVNTSKVSQFFFLVVFFILFIMTEYRGKDDIFFAINGFFRANPLVATTYILSMKSITPLILPGLLLIVFAFLLGRFFCGWICPLGTIIDLFTDRIKKKDTPPFFKTRFKYYLLLTLLSASFFGVNISGLLDPIGILVRAMTFFIYPLFGFTIRSGWTGLYSLFGDSRDYIEPLYGFIRDHIMPFRETFYPLAFLSTLMIFTIILLERYGRRNWCRNICPLGTLLGLFGRLSIVKRIPVKLCGDCRQCKDTCPTGFDQDILQRQDCILCMECKIKCSLKRVHFPIRLPSFKKDTVNPSERRIFLTGIVSGFALSKIFTFREPSSFEHLLRPPGVRKEDEFLRACVRCGECIKVCLKNALYPSSLQAGLYGLYTPILIPRLGYCEYNCNLCGQVCPTGAIPHLPIEEKRKFVIGTAVIDRNRCLPYEKRINCIVCEEHCPIPDKAIRFEVSEEIDYSGRKVLLKKPYVKEELCNGCGICENKCPLEGKSAIVVFSTGKVLKKRV
ncbi:MAG: 4Fe-4S binding protein [Syntrophorhabdaceae bacterium]|nr:4Fe-4S binding protein [Syntrophorhabdaceae bacterium]